MLEIIFFGSIFAIFYAYFGYGFSLFLIGLIRKEKAKTSLVNPEVSIIIAAHNEEERIRQKLENTLMIDYPRENLQVIVASDASTDKTHNIVRDYSLNGIELVVIPDRKGKENAQKEAISRARGDVFIFTDVATMLEPGGVKQIVSNFSDPSVGSVSSTDRVIGKDGNPAGESFYVKYEMWLRRLESQVNTVVGLSGSFFAVRREICDDFSPDMQSDFRTVLSTVRRGYRSISDPRAIGYYQDIVEGQREFTRKVRTVVRGLTVFFKHLEFLNLFRYGLFSYQLFCHKLLRWLVPFFLCISLVANAGLVRGSLFFSIIFIVQLGFYGIAILGIAGRYFSKLLPVKVPAYFLTVNLSILVAWWRYLTGQRMVTWTPSKR